MKWLVFLLIGLLIGIGIGIAYQKAQPVHSNIVLKLPRLGKPALQVNPQSGDTLSWNLPPGVSTKWILDISPCTGVPSPCLIAANADKQKFAYSCRDANNKSVCDPDIPVGSDTEPLHPDSTPTNTSDYPEIDIGCSAGKPMGADPAAASVSKSTQGGVFWSGLGAATTWTVGTWKDSHDQPATVCVETTISQDHRTCTIDPGVTPGAIFNYTATSAACAAQSAPFTLAVN